MKKIFLILTAAFTISKSFPQNVGIGTTTPAFKLDVRYGSINTDSVYRINTFPVISLGSGANFFAGKNAGASSTGAGNTSAGDSTLFSNTIGTSNTAVGNKSLFSNITGFYNTACGDLSLKSNTSGIQNTAVGEESLSANTIGIANVAVGSGALLANTTGTSNAANGKDALYSNTTGDANTASGESALGANTTGNYNTAVGGEALNLNHTGVFNTAIGFWADVTITNLNNATAIGASSKVSCSHCLALGGNGSNHTNVGINNPAPLTDLHIIQQTDAGGDKVRGIRLQRFVNTNHWRTLIDPSNNYVFEYNDGLYTYINPTTGAYINPSDARLKKDVTPLENLLNKVMALTPKKFHYKTNKDGDPLLWGFIAQDIQKIFPEFVDVKDDGYLGISYTNFSVVAIKAIQEQQAEIEELKNRNQKLEERLLKIEKQLFSKNELQ